MIKLIVMDLDGTLLRTDKTVSEHTMETLYRCKQMGIKTAIATARGHPENIVPVERFDARILCNGAVIIADGKTLRQTITYQEARPLLMACNHRGLIVSSQFDDTHYTNIDIASVWPDIKKWKTVDFSRHEVDVEKINVNSVTMEDITFIEQNMTPNMYIKVAREDRLGMIMHKNATKSKAVSKLAGIFCIAQDEIVAFGDDANDIDMLSYAGVGVAMRNAIDEVKAVADEVCESNDNDGIAKWIEERIFNAERH